MIELDSLGIRPRFGDYTITGPLGHGSTSAVFAAVQAGEGFSRKVAIKVILGTTPASLSIGETRILAQLDHPKIARLLDVGLTEFGLRYLVMEFVEGVSCTEFAEQNRLSERERLLLFQQICEAVQYANRALVIHCDLKPANVLVTPDGAVKLLDFGIARLLSESSSAASAESRVSAYTANYASPEQILGKPLSMSTDVYALGAMLCELVSGNPARNAPQLSHEELVRLASVDGAPATLSGDLAQIAQKAMRADPALRYANAGELSADIRRYLEGQPIEARPSSLTYRARKFIARNWQASAAAALVSLGVLVGTLIAFQQRALAQAHFAQIRTLANAVMFDLHDEIAKLPGSLEPRHLLVNRAVQYLESLRNSAPTDDEVQLEVAKGLLRLADIEGVGNEPSLGNSNQAVPRISQAEHIVRTVVARTPASLPARRALYQVLETQATLGSLRGSAAIATAEELLKLAEDNAASLPGNGEVEDELAHAISVHANMYTQSPQFGHLGVDRWRAAVAKWKQLADAQPASVLRKRELARSYQYLAGALTRTPAREEAREMATIAYRMHKELEKIPGETVRHMIAADVGLIAVVSAQLKRYEEAIPMFQEQLRIREALAAEDPDNANAFLGVGGSLNRIGTAYLRLNQPDKALPYLQRSLDVQRKVFAQDPENVLSSREMLYVTADLSEAYDMLHQREPMCRYAAEGAVIMKGPISRTKETGADLSKKDWIRKALGICGIRP